MNAQNCSGDEGCFCRKPLELENYYSDPPRTTFWTRFKKRFGL